MAVEDSMISRNEFNTGYAERVRSFIEGLKGGKGDYRFERGLLATILIGDMVAGGSYAPANMINGVTQAASKAINIEETVRALEAELDKMDNSQATGEGVKNIDDLDASTEKEVAESEVTVTDAEDEDEEESSDEAEESKE